LAQSTLVIFKKHYGSRIKLSEVLIALTTDTIVQWQLHKNNGRKIQKCTSNDHFKAENSFTPVLIVDSSRPHIYSVGSLRISDLALRGAHSESGKKMEDGLLALWRCRFCYPKNV
jgi:hypothetical protein